MGQTRNATSHGHMARVGNATFNKKSVHSPGNVKWISEIADTTLGIEGTEFHVIRHIDWIS